MSYDDGSEHDRRLVDLFDRHGIRGTFHLNSTRLDAPHHVGGAEVASLYARHEIASHTATHPDLMRLDDDAVRQEIADDCQRLQALAGRPVRGFAYPFGAYDERIIGVARSLGLAYARTADATRAFGLPPDRLLWPPSCHHNAAMPLAQAFLAAPCDSMALLCIAGHSYELDGFMSADPSMDWHYMETLCRLLQGHATLWYATMIEVADYLRALEEVQWSDAGVHNRSPTTIWVERDGEAVALAPGAWWQR